MPPARSVGGGLVAGKFAIDRSCRDFIKGFSTEFPIPMETSTKVKIAAAIAVIAGPFLTYNGHAEKNRLAELERDGITVDGEITGGESRKRRRSRSYELEVEYKLANGGTLKKEFPVTSDFFKEHTTEDFISDPAVKVRYLEKDPQNSAILVGGSTDDTAMFPVGIGAFVLGLGTLGFMTLRKRETS
jgi:hypothetical protein